MTFVSVHMVHSYSTINTAIAWKKSCLISSDRYDFHMIDKQSTAFYVFARCMLISLSVDEMLLPKYVNLFTKNRGWPLRVAMLPFCKNYIYSVLFSFTWKPKPPVVCSKICSRVYTESAKSSKSVIVSTGYLFAFSWVKLFHFIRSIFDRNTSSRRAHKQIWC